MARETMEREHVQEEKKELPTVLIITRVLILGNRSYSRKSEYVGLKNRLDDKQINEKYK